MNLMVAYVMLVQCPSMTITLTSINRSLVRLRVTAALSKNSNNI